MTIDDSGALTLLLILRDEGQPMTFEQLAARSMFHDEAQAECLVELCNTGPAVYVDIGGEPHIALEWGVRHSAELPVDNGPEAGEQT